MHDHDDLIGDNPTWKTPFYRLLHKHLPEHRSTYLPSALLNVAKLAKDLKISKQATYKWIMDGRFPPNRMMSLVKLPGSTLTVEKLLPFGAFKD